MIVNTTSFGNVTVWIVDQLLDLPQDLAATVPAENMSLAGINAVLQNIHTPLFNGSTNTTANTTLFAALNSGFHGFTFFAPNTSAVAAVQSTLRNFSSTQVQSVLYNHVCLR